MSRIFCIIIFLLIASSLYAENWEKKTAAHTLKQNQFLSMDFATDASGIRWIVTCSEKCHIYLLTSDDFEKMTRGMSFKYLRYKPNVVADAGSLDSEKDIRKKLIILVINKEATDNLASIEIEQNVPKKSNFGALDVIMMSIVIGALVIGFSAALYVTVKQVFKNGTSPIWNYGGSNYQPQNDEVTTERDEVTTAIEEGNAEETPQ